VVSRLQNNKNEDGDSCTFAANYMELVQHVGLSVCIT